MITVKQYAEERSITIQAVHQSMKGKYKKDALVGHVHTVEGVKWLDDEAVRILDEFRHRSPVVIEREDINARIQEMEENEKVLLAKIAAQADRISELAEWKAENALLIAGAAQTQLLLDNTKAELDQAKADKAALETENNEIRENAQQAILDAQEAQQREADQRQRAEAAEAELAALKSMTVWQRVFGWGKNR